MHSSRGNTIATARSDAHFLSAEKNTSPVGVAAASRRSEAEGILSSLDVQERRLMARAEVRGQVWRADPGGNATARS